MTRKALLKHVTIAVHPGEVAFVMGPSGAGKSTLLDALAGRIKRGIMSGAVYFNGRVRGEDFYAHSAYVRQDDVHIPTLTVDETLYFAARLRLSEREYTDAERRARMNAVADLLGLHACLPSMVGDSGMRGISGGQVCGVEHSMPVILVVLDGYGGVSLSKRMHTHSIFVVCMV